MWSLYRYLNSNGAAISSDVRCREWLGIQATGLEQKTRASVMGARLKGPQHWTDPSMDADNDRCRAQWQKQGRKMRARRSASHLGPDYKVNASNEEGECSQRWKASKKWNGVGGRRLRSDGLSDVLKEDINWGRTCSVAAGTPVATDARHRASGSWSPVRFTECLIEAGGDQVPLWSSTPEWALTAGRQWSGHAPMYYLHARRHTEPGTDLSAGREREELGKSPAIPHFLPIQPTCPWGHRQGAVCHVIRTPLLPPKSHSDTSMSQHPPGV